MTLTATLLATYLGRSAVDLLSVDPLSKWQWNRVLEKDLEDPLISYDSSQNGMCFLCDESENVQTIFVYNMLNSRFAGGLDDLPFSFSREQVIDAFGFPSKSGRPISDPILGNYGAWDRFERDSFTIHFEYHLDSMSIKRITLMRWDVVP